MKVHLDWLEEGISWSGGLKECQGMPPSTRSKHPESVMAWGAFSGNKGRGGLYFLPKNVTMRGDNYLRVLDQHMLPFWDIH